MLQRRLMLIGELSHLEEHIGQTVRKICYKFQRIERIICLFKLTNSIYFIRTVTSAVWTIAKLLIPIHFNLAPFLSMHFFSHYKAIGLGEFIDNTLYHCLNMGHPQHCFYVFSFVVSDSNSNLLVIVLCSVIFFVLFLVVIVGYCFW